MKLKQDSLSEILSQKEIFVSTRKIDNINNLNVFTYKIYLIIIKKYLYNVLLFSHKKVIKLCSQSFS